MNNKIDKCLAGLNGFSTGIFAKISEINQVMQAVEIQRESLCFMKENQDVSWSQWDV